MSFLCLRVGFRSLKRNLSQLEFYKDRASQVKAIEKSFDAVKQPVSHYYLILDLVYFKLFIVV